MRHHTLPVPGLLWGSYPERRVMRRSLGERCNAALRAIADRGAFWQAHRDAAFVARVRAAEAALALAGPNGAALASLRLELVRGGLAPAALARAFGMVSLVARQQLGQRPFDTQLIAARAVLDNRLAEMATGEGKTLAIALAAASAALAGIPVHVITANDYLVARDAQRLQALYAALGLSVGSVAQPDAPAQRAAAYGCDITYVTAKELVFDYLRDGVQGAPDAMGATLRPRDAPAAALARPGARPSASAPLLRGLCMAIVDEADAILIDEARLPLILSRRADMTDAHDHAAQALRYARTLRPAADFTLDAGALAAQLTAHGQERLARAAASLDAASLAPAWRNRQHREHSVCLALAALHLIEPGRHYLVRDGAVVIIDETTGRLAEGRAWSSGLQQLIEHKEACKPSPALATLAQLTYQRVFPRYLRLGGVSGTLRESRAELLATYGLAVRAIPLRQPCQRRTGPTRLFADHAALWSTVTQRAAVLHRIGQPLMVATDSVAEAQALSDCLADGGLPHAVLHARCDHDEAQIVARAGQRGAITVTTNMAGRGTDIELGPGVAGLGGLHVLCCQLNGARRIDRQLAGRAARQGDPGSVETWLSLDTALLARSLPAALRNPLRRWATALPSCAVRWLARTTQAFEEQRQREQRERLIRRDEQMERQLAFGGPGE